MKYVSKCTSYKETELKSRRLFQLLPSEVEEAELSGNDNKLVSMYGWAISINPLGQMIASPLLGYLNSRMGSTRPAMLLTGVLVVVSNSLYSMLSLFPESQRYAMLILSRFLTGCSAGEFL